MYCIYGNITVLYIRKHICTVYKETYVSSCSTFNYKIKSRSVFPFDCIVVLWGMQLKLITAKHASYI